MCALCVSSNRSKITSVQVYARRSKLSEVLASSHSSYDRFARSLLAALGSNDPATQLYACRLVALFHYLLPFLFDFIYSPLGV
jgi:hypothetical protein